MTWREATAAVALWPSRGSRDDEDGWASIPTEIVLGKDVLELLSMSMYVDPMTIYREYVQNAADAIDEARCQGLLEADGAGNVEIDIDPAGRTIRIRDSGTGIGGSDFARQLTALGASPKRGTAARGFRGVGRLAGLGYGQELIFRSRVAGERHVSELRWDCRRLSAALRAADFQGGLADLIREIVSVRRIMADGYPERFFEVEIRGVVRHRNDRLLSPPVVAEYLSQVGPVPFAPDFRFGAEIATALAPHCRLGNLDVRVTGIDGPLYRPHRDRFEVGEGAFEGFNHLEVRHIPGVDGSVAAVAWILHHGYTGAIPSQALVKGLRVRAGNIQVGDAALLEDLFPETRFNAWSVGEVHVIDPRIVPNGRRDHFQSNVHFNNLLNHLSPVARDIARRCRTNSINRKLLREFELQSGIVGEKITILKQGALGVRDREPVIRTARNALMAMDKIAKKDGLGEHEKLNATIAADRKALEKAVGSYMPASPLAGLSPAKRKMYEHLFGLVYECSTNRVAAKALIDRILLKIG